MHANPRRIADDDVKPASGGDVGEVRGKGEGKCSTFSQCFDFVPRLSQPSPNSLQSETCLMIRLMAESEQIWPAHQQQQLPALRRQSDSASRECVDVRRTFDPVQRPRQRELARAGRSHISRNQTSEYATAGDASRVIEGGGDQRAPGAK